MDGLLATHSFFAGHKRRCTTPKLQVSLMRIAFSSAAQGQQRAVRGGARQFSKKDINFDAVLGRHTCALRGGENLCVDRLVLSYKPTAAKC